ncbi:NEDD4-binding protein 2 [Anastrepha ludens]|uniref:NEDD4-binding protein 2 n=1 Tax=Anastrepha ludens TaxID=28586 RepID=UPI0023B02F44|nr:NEDD4-binding protein 2 [Anastrepha ludens]
MQNTSYISKNTQLSEEEKHNVLQKLVDIFNCSPSPQLRSLCESQAWNVERCIDFLIRVNNKDENENQRKLRSGAIPKQIFKGEKNVVQKLDSANGAKNQNISSGSSFVEQRIAKLIADGSKVMVLLRGAPGSGKSCLAKNFVERHVTINEQYTLKDFIFSSDDFFRNSTDTYNWQPSLLDQAHDFNQRRVEEHAQAGWSPIFVDNTNIKLWEMKAYARIAVENGYVIEILEPRTSWRYSAGKLALKNKHGVPAHKLQIMLNNFEKGTVDDLLKMLKTTKYHVPLPQMRSIPPISFGQQDTETEEVFQIYKPEKNNSNVSDASTTSENPFVDESAPKAQRERSASKQKSVSATIELQQPPPLIQAADGLNEIQSNELNAWQPHEQEINKFWNMKPSSSDKQEMSQKNEHQRKSLLDLLREGVSDVSKPQSYKDKNEQSMNQEIVFERHSNNCPNENKGFASLRQIYPNKELSSLWDLFVKCGGNIDWTVDLLLREDELIHAPGSQYFEQVPQIVNDFQCNCGTQPSVADESITVEIPPTPTDTSFGKGAKPQRQRSRASRVHQRTNPELQEITDAIANRFVLDGEQFSPHIRKLREMRERLRNPTAVCYTSTEVQTEPITEVELADDDADPEINEIIEVNLGEDLVKQLNHIFQSEMTSLVEKLPHNPILNVFMPRSLAKELYMLWIESAYNQLEEQRQVTTREDSDFARLLTNPKYEYYSESPGNIQELLDMEFAWQIYKNDQDTEIHKTSKIQEHYRPSDLAAHLTQMKLCEKFPSIPRETLVEILSAHGNNYDETVKVLSITTQAAEGYTVSDLQKKLIDCTLEEQEKIKKEQQNSNKNNGHSGASEDRLTKAPSQPEEAKRMALHDFEEMRNLAAHHSQLKAECYQKAKEAIQKGNSAVAVYYSQIANLHKMKLDMYNHRAANCIMDVHKYTQNNPELLDLHYLHVMEAIGCLDLFLDRHITGLRAASRSYKHIFIITGRGLHSAGGVSTIKNKVKTRLKERNLRWSEVNPGLLKVKIFSASRHSKNI